MVEHLPEEVSKARLPGDTKSGPTSTSQKRGGDRFCLALPTCAQQVGAVWGIPVVMPM